MSSENSVITAGKKPSTSSESSKSTDGDSASYRKEQDNVHGHIFQLQLLMLFLCRGVKRGYSFRLGTEITEAGKFDDLVFEYVGKDGGKKYMLIQIKHKRDKCEKISADELLTTSGGDYGLVKYFNSYHNSKKEESFKDGAIENIFICTNIDVDSKSLSEKKIGYKRVDEENEILTHRGIEEQAAQYKFNEDVGSLLKPKLYDYRLTELADTLMKHCLEYRDIRHHQGIFRNYHKALAEEVIDVKKKKLYEKFTKPDGISEIAVKFRNAFEKAIEQHSKGEITLANFNAKIDNKEFGFKLSRKFGQSKNDEEKFDWPDDSIFDDDVNEYLNRLVLAVNQPDEERLKEIILNEIGKGINQITTKNMYNKMYTKMMDWMRGKGKKFLSFEDGAKFLEVAKAGVSIWFNVSDPVDSFTGRIEKLQELYESLKGGDTAISQTVSIGGLGGVGKSELARKYAKEYSKYYDHNVIWINAETHQSLAESFAKLARTKLGIKTVDSNGEEKDMVSIVEEVYRFFSKEESLFIFDNAVRRRSTTDGNEGIKKYLPTLPSDCKRPHILITSRNQAWGDMKVLALDVFTKDEAIEFIKKKLLIENNEPTKAAIDLADELQYFPLALDQAVAYIRETDRGLKNMGKEFKIRDYLKRYKTKTKELLNSSFSENSDNSYEKTTYTTWDITIESMRQQKHGEKALKILDTAAYFLPDRISSQIFVNLEGTDEEDLGCSIEMLKQYSMVKSEEDASILSIHRLVQNVTRLKQKVDDREVECMRTALKLFKDPVNIDPVKRQEVRFENPLEHTDNVDQARSVMNYASEHGELVRDFVDLPGRIVERLRNLFRYREAGSFGETMLKVLERDVGPDSVKISELMRNTAIVLLDQGKYELALNYFEKVKSIQGDKTPVHNYIGSILRAQGKFDKAIEAFQKTIEMNNSRADSFQASHNIAEVMIDQGRYKEALKTLRTLLNDRVDDLNLVNIAKINSTMALALEKQELYTDALELYERAHEEFSKCRTPEDHTAALNTRYAIARMKYHLRQYESCLDIFREILEEREKLVPDHPFTLATKGMIVLALLQLNKVDDAVGILDEVTDESVKTCIKPDNSDSNAIIFDQIIQLAAERGYLEVAIIALEKGIDPFVTSTTFRDPRRKHVAVLSENDDTIQLEVVEPSNDTIGPLNMRNMNITQSINHKSTSEPYIRIELLDIEKKILRSAERRNIIDDKATIDKVAAIHIAVQNGHKEIVDVFLEKGKKNVNVSTADQRLSPLHLAAKYDHSEIVQCLLEKDAKIDAIAKNRFTPLHYAALEGRLNIVEILLKKGAKFDAIAVYDTTPLHLAAVKGHLGIVEILLEKGGKIDAITENRFTPLHYAALEGRLDIVEILLKKGAKFDAIDKDHSTPLHLAAVKGHLGIVEILLEKGANLDAINRDHMTPLHLAACNGHLKVVEILLEKGANFDAIDKDHSTPLHLEAVQSHLDVVETSFEKGAKIDAVIGDDPTPLHFAAYNGHLDVVKILLEKGANFDAIDKDHSTPLQLAADKGHRDVVTTLIEKGAKIDAITQDCRTPLHFAAHNGHRDVVEILLENGAQIDAMTVSDSTPLHFAAVQDHLDIVKILVKKGAKIEAITNNDFRLLYRAAQNSHLDIDTTLLERDAKFNAFIKVHSTPLHLAAQYGYPDIVQFLLEKNAEINAITGDQFTPLHLAAHNGHLNIVKTLLEKGAKIDPITKGYSTLAHFRALDSYLPIMGVLFGKCQRIDAMLVNHSTPLHLAVGTGRLGIVGILLGKGAKINAITEDHLTPLHLAACSGYKDVVEILLENGAQIDAIDHYNITPLHLAVVKGHLDIVSTLLEKGAEIDAIIKDHITPLRLAELNGHSEIVKMLLEKGAKSFCTKWSCSLT